MVLSPFRFVKPPGWLLRWRPTEDGCGAVTRLSQGTGTQRDLRASAIASAVLDGKPVDRMKAAHGFNVAMNSKRPGGMAEGESAGYGNPAKRRGWRGGSS
jgi:hypothetical protein